MAQTKTLTKQHFLGAPGFNTCLGRIPWIGLNEIEYSNNFRWVQGPNYANEPLGTYTNWLGHRQPSRGDCMKRGNTHGGAWDHHSCYQADNAYLCQIRF